MSTNPSSETAGPALSTEVTGHEANTVLIACPFCGAVFTIPRDYTSVTCPTCGAHTTR